MKSLIASILILGLVGMVVGAAVKAATEGSVTATVTPGVVSVIVSPNSFDYGYMTLNTSKTSHEAGQTSGITATVGGVNTDLEIKGADATSSSGSWTLVGTPGSDEYVHEFGEGADPSSYTTLTTTYVDLASVSASGSYVFGLRITTPTSSTYTEEYSVPTIVLASWGG
ncbi:hypothetical protein KJA13_01520 [Patescibacteria group bacterium]|nr:hypothetical protein [Patescibacteria group bacterium]